MIKKLWQHLTNRRRRQFWMLLCLMIIASAMEIISIGTVVPFLGALTSPEQIFNHSLAQPIIQAFQITEPNQILLPFTIIFIVAIVISALVRLFLLYALTRLSFSTGTDISVNIYRRTLYQEYSIHTTRNSSDIINSVITKTNTVIGAIIVPLLNLISSTIILIGIVGAIFFINAQIALITFSMFVLLYWAITFFTKRALQNNSQLIADKSTQMVKSLQEGLGGIRDVLIDNSQEFYCRLYRDADLRLRRASGNNIFIANSPRFLMEGIGVILIATLAFFLARQEAGIAGAIPILGALALGAQKMLPSLQQAYASYSAMKGSESSFNDVLDLLDQPMPQANSENSSALLSFKKDITFKDLSFRYSPDSSWVLKDVNLSFTKGEKIGFIGTTGSGKSTIMDILMGLLQPTSGELLIDGVVISQDNRRAWQEHISHVPQSIFLADSTIQENIAFGVESTEINVHKVIHAAQKAQISGMINDLINKYKSFVGERGTRLSGGQKQRIGIARAFYKDTDVLVLDEATSALDEKTEQEIMQHINNMKENPTIFIIAHRISTLKQCDRVIRINTDNTIEQMNYNQINKL
jgi:ATP-binding cassette, subfamily B, bacterial PglK